jgi:hypothetical protein
MGEAGLRAEEPRSPDRKPGIAPVAVVMIALNEAHNMEGVLRNLEGWAQEVFLVDSYSADDTVDIALRHGVHVVQRAFKGFGDQWNFALRELPIAAPWTMKLDPDERLTDALKRAIELAIAAGDAEGLSVDRRLSFMGRQLPVKHGLVRVWCTGRCRFTEVQVNEHPVVDGRIRHVAGELEHHDSPDLEHWLDKQNRYTSAEAVSAFHGLRLADQPRLFGTALQRRMWIKKHFMKVPFRYVAMFLYHYLVLGAWRAGWVGYAWSRLRCDVYRLWEYKLWEIRITGRLPLKRPAGPGQPDPRVRQY